MRATAAVTGKSPPAHRLSAKEARKKNALKAFDWLNALLDLRLQNRSLQRRVQKAGQLTNVVRRRQLTRVNRGLQAIDNRVADLLEYLCQTLSNALAFVARLDAEIADQTTAAELRLPEERDLDVDPLAETEKGRA